MVPSDPPLASTRLRRQQPLSGFAGCGRLCATDGDGRGSTARHPTTHGWWLPEYAHARTSKVNLASTPSPWCHPGERRVPVLPTERALDPLFDLLHHADPRHTHTARGRSFDLDEAWLGSSRRSQSFPRRVGFHQHACVVPNLYTLSEGLRQRVRICVVSVQLLQPYFVNWVVGQQLVWNS